MPLSTSTSASTSIKDTTDFILCFDPLDGTFVQIDFDHVHEQEDICSAELTEQARKDCRILILILSCLAIFILILLYISSSLLSQIN